MKFEEFAEGRHSDESHPARGAWIEMRCTFENYRIGKVAPRKGCVD